MKTVKLNKPFNLLGLGLNLRLIVSEERILTLQKTDDDLSSKSSYEEVCQTEWETISETSVPVVNTLIHDGFVLCWEGISITDTVEIYGLSARCIKNNGYSYFKTLSPNLVDGSEASGLEIGISPQRNIEWGQIVTEFELNKNKEI